MAAAEPSNARIASLLAVHRHQQDSVMSNATPSAKAHCAATWCVFMQRSSGKATAATGGWKW